MNPVKLSLVRMDATGFEFPQRGITPCQEGQGEKYLSEIQLFGLLIQEIVQQLREYTTLIMQCKVDRKVLTATSANLSVSDENYFLFFSPKCDKGS